MRPVLLLPAKTALFSSVSAIVIRLMPSPPVVGLIDCVFEAASTNWMFATLDHRDIARRAAPRTSLPGLMLAPGDLSELESATVIVFFTHFIWTLPEESVS